MIDNRPDDRPALVLGDPDDPVGFVNALRAVAGLDPLPEPDDAG